MFKNFWVLLFFSCYTLINAQVDSSQDIIQKGIELYDNGSYAEAVEQFKLVNENDSNYNWMLAELSLTYLSMDKYDSVIVIADKGLAAPGNCHVDLLRNKGTAYDDMGDKQKAIEIYEYALKKYPFKYLLHYNLGISYLSIDEFEKAQHCFENAIRCNPFHASSHLQLGKLVARQKQLTRAFLSLETFLSLEPASNRSNSVLIYLENLANNYLDTTQGHFIEPIENNDLFEEIDHYVRAGIVLTARYQSPIDFNASMIKQTKMLMQVLPLDDTNNTDFWVQTYFPFYKGIKDGAYLTPFLYNVLRSTGYDDVNKYLNKHEKELNAFYDTGSDLAHIKFHHTIDIGEGLKEYECSYYENGNMQALGHYDENEKEQGPWRYYYSNGEISAEGIFTDGVKDSVWRYFDNDGRLSSVETYKKGALSGDYINYHQTGNMSLVVPYVDGEVNGKVIWYDEFGLKVSSIQFENSKKQGEGISFFASQHVSEKYAYKDNSIDGAYFSYYDNGQVDIAEIYKEGKADGSYKSYFANGRLAVSGTYKEDKAEGVWYNYYMNGNISLIDTFSQGNLIGIYKKFYHNGTIQEEGNYNEAGKKNGSTKYYDEDGILMLEEVYKNDEFEKATNYKSDGSIIASYSGADGIVKFSTYHADGSLLLQGTLKDREKSGEFKYFYKNGNIKQVCFYKNGLLDGELIDYYENGLVKDKMFYSDDVLNGEYSAFNKAGILTTHGYYKEGKQDNQWVYYYNDGSLDREVYILEGKAQGWSTDYDVDGNVQTRVKYLNNKMLLYQNYNQAGELVAEYDLLKEPKYEIKGDAAYVSAESNMKGGLYYGDFIWYYANGKILSKKTFVNDKVDGKYERFDEDGQLMTTGNYISGFNEGKWLNYYPDGKIQKETFYFNDEKDSTETGYYENGNVEYVKNYYSGLLNGSQEFYDMEGNLQIKIICDMDELVGYQYYKGESLCEMISVKADDKITAFFKNGKKSFEADLKNFCYEGAYVKYNASGTLSELRNYKNGLLNGKYVTYYANEKVKAETNYLFDEKDGPETIYWDNGHKKMETDYKKGEGHGKKIRYDRSGKILWEAKNVSDRVVGYKKL